ncbi:MAG TPA: hypothetical protein VF702_09735 [Allosphingosinicella sp.]|jgi:hypothetical protein
MFHFDRIVRTASAAVCSLILTSVAIGATLAPAQADANSPSAFAALASESANG